jgi:hypothetical protein
MFGETGTNNIGVLLLAVLIENDDVGIETDNIVNRLSQIAYGKGDNL